MIAIAPTYLAEPTFTDVAVSSSWKTAAPSNSSSDRTPWAETTQKDYSGVQQRLAYWAPIAPGTSAASAGWAGHEQTSVTRQLRSLSQAMERNEQTMSVRLASLETKVSALSRAFATATVWSQEEVAEDRTVTIPSSPNGAVEGEQWIAFFDDLARMAGASDDLQAFVHAGLASGDAATRAAAARTLGSFGPNAHAAALIEKQIAREQSTYVRSLLEAALSDATT